MEDSHGICKRPALFFGPLLSPVSPIVRLRRFAVSSNKQPAVSGGEPALTSSRNARDFGSDSEPDQPDELRDDEQRSRPRRSVSPSREPAPPAVEATKQPPAERRPPPAARARISVVTAAALPLVGVEGVQRRRRKAQVKRLARFEDEVVIGGAHDEGAAAAAGRRSASPARPARRHRRQTRCRSPALCVDELDLLGADAEYDRAVRHARPSAQQSRRHGRRRRAIVPSNVFIAGRPMNSAMNRVAGRR